jgi:hypothetical protein
MDDFCDFAVPHGRDDADMPVRAFRSSGGEDPKATDFGFVQREEQSCRLICIIDDGVGVDPTAIEADIEGMVSFAGDAQTPTDEAAAIASVVNAGGGRRIRINPARSQTDT